MLSLIPSTAGGPFKFLILFCVIISVSGCTWFSNPPEPTEPVLGQNYFLSRDGQRLPYRRWLPPTPVETVIVALHGFNDYSRFFSSSGAFLAGLGVASYAYDQRGFGGAPQRGRWAGSETYQQDLKDFVQLVKTRHAAARVYVLGESMGGAIGIVSSTMQQDLAIDGLILSAPAVWGRSSMPWYQTSLLWTSARLTPWLTVTGSGLKITPSDNTEMLIRLGRDPLVIKETRIDTIEGLVDLMDQAQNNAAQLDLPVLLLYGEKDEIIPKEPTYRVLQQLLDASGQVTVAVYPEGYHMLLRDLQANVVLRDIASWVQANDAALPSKADQHAQGILAELE